MAQVPMPWSCIQSDFIELGIRNKRSVEKQKLEGRKIEIEARKIEIDARKIGDQKRLTCQKHKVKERNVANNYEKYIEFFFAQFDPLLRTRKNIVFGELQHYFFSFYQTMKNGAITSMEFLKLF